MTLHFMVPEMTRGSSLFCDVSRGSHHDGVVESILDSGVRERGSSCGVSDFCVCVAFVVTARAARLWVHDLFVVFTVRRSLALKHVE